MSTNNKEDVQELIDNITEQLQELEVLTAMYPEELVMTDPTLIIDAREYCESQGQSSIILQSLNFDLSLASQNCSSNNDAASDKREENQYLHFKLSVKLPKSYPSIERPELSIIADRMSRAELTNAKNAMNDFVSTLALDEQILLEIIMWLQETLVTFIDKDSKSSVNETKDIKTGSDVFVSMWLYMHHIYSKHKRKDIQNWSRDYDLTGFSLPGKPGVVYIEGLEANVDAYFERLKSLPWKSIKCRTRENICTRVFDNFKELCFQPHGARNYHMDLGLFYNFLVEHGLSHMFKEIFGVEGQLKDE